MYHRFAIFVLVAAGVSLLLLIGLYQFPFDFVRKPILSDYISILSDHDESPDHDVTNITMTNSTLDTFNTTYPLTNLVLATLSKDDNTWLTSELSDLLGPQTNLYTAIYTVNDRTAELHTPANKGHEAMAYLTYIIDFYTTLPPISIFLHGHPTAWHNNYLLSMSTSQMIRHLSREKVLREGYVNLRCHWSPGCPAHLHPHATDYDSNKPEELHIKATWAELFPEDPLPGDLAQPCCSQFAVSREAILRYPLEKYIHFRDWLLNTKLEDYITGRILEYFWQYIFLGEAEYCPDPRICYCDGYGVCFEDPDEYVRFSDLVTEMEKLKKEMQAWRNFEQGKLFGRGDEAEDDEDPALIGRASRDGDDGPDPVVEGGDSRQVWLEQKIHEIEEELTRRKDAAFEAGRDPARRAWAIEAARNQSIENPKDGPPFWTQR